MTGDRTVEGFKYRKGILTIYKPDGRQEIFQGDASTGLFAADVEVGELMQWEAAEDEMLVAYEVCFPPYEDGRFENIV